MSMAAVAEAHDEQPGLGEPREYQLQDREGRTRPFTGWRLARESTETDTSRRWTELEAYRTEEGKYVLRTLGCSIEYHQHNSECNTGEPTLGRDMDLDLEPCRRCRPTLNYKADRLADTLFDVEVEIPTLRISDTPGEFIESLRPNSGKSPGELSLVAFRLLRALRRVDPGIRAELSKPQRVQ